jgi:hypothetical protein
MRAVLIQWAGAGFGGRTSPPAAAQAVAAVGLSSPPRRGLTAGRGVGVDGGRWSPVAHRSVRAVRALTRGIRPVDLAILAGTALFVVVVAGFGWWLLGR